MENNSPTLIELEVHELIAYKKPSFWRLVFRSAKEESYLLLLAPVGSQPDTIKLPILIGKHEAMQMTIVIEGMNPKMPLTADLFKTATDAFGYKLDFVTIDKVDEEHIFHSTMMYSNEEKKIELHARVSDAITMALKYKSPIYTVPELLTSAEQYT